MMTSAVQDAKVMQSLLRGVKSSELLDKKVFPFVASVLSLYLLGFVILNILNKFYDFGVGEPTPKGDLYFVGAAITFFLSLIVDIIGWIHTINPLKRRLYSVICLTNFLAGATYITFLFDLGPLWPTVVNGRPYNPLIYIEWSATTSNLIFFIGHLSETAGWKVAIIIFFDVMMMVFGLFARMTLEYSFTMELVSYLCAIPSMGGLYFMLTEATKNTVVQQDVESIKTLRFVTILVWAAFPVVYEVGKVGIINVSTEALFNTLLDINAKAIFSSVLLGHFLFTADQMRALKALDKKGDQATTVTDREGLVDGVECSQSILDLLEMAKVEVENMKEIQKYFLAGICLSCTVLLGLYYIPAEYRIEFAKILRG